MYLRGQRQGEIAEHFDVNISTISRDLATIRQEWLSSRVRDFDQAKAEELAKIDKVEAEGWLSWDETRDHRHMAIVQWAIEQRCKILGVYAAVKNEHVGPNGGPLVNSIVKGYVEVSPDDWDDSDRADSSL